MLLRIHGTLSTMHWGFPLWEQKGVLAACLYAWACSPASFLANLTSISCCGGKNNKNMCIYIYICILTQVLSWAWASYIPLRKLFLFWKGVSALLKNSAISCTIWTMVALSYLTCKEKEEKKYMKCRLPWFLKFAVKFQLLQVSESTHKLLHSFHHFLVLF